MIIIKAFDKMYSIREMNGSTLLQDLWAQQKKRSLKKQAERMLASFLAFWWGIWIYQQKKKGKRDCDLRFHMPGGGTNPVPMEQWLHCTTHNLESEGGSRPNHRPNSPQMVVWMEDQMGAFRGMKLSPHLWFLFIMFWIVLAYIYIYIHRRFIWTVHLNHFESTWYQHLHKCMYL